MNDQAPSLRDVRKDLPDWLVTAVDGALKRDPADRWQSARTMRDVLKTKGKAPIELDWEVHEDATVRTEGLFGQEQERPATIRLLQKDDEPSEPSIEVDLEISEPPIAPPVVPEAAYDASGGRTLRSEIPPAFLQSEPPPKKKAGSGLWLGVLLGAVVMGLVMLGVGWAVYAHLLGG